MSHWIIAPVVLPALVAALMVLALRGHLALQRIASLAAILALNAIAVALSALMVALLAFLALVTTLYAIGSGWDAKGAHFHPLLQFLLMGVGGAFLTGDAFNLFVFFEVLLIASYGLMIHGGGDRRTRAGIQYIAFNLVGSSLFLFALALLYGVTGTLNLADLAQKLPTLPPGDAALLRVAAVMLILVFAIKGALVPLQFWLPGTYANAPGVVAALFAIMTKVGAYATLRFATLVFPIDLPATGMLIPAFLLPAALVTLAIGALGILGASTLPRLAAFAGIASMGTTFLAIAHMTPQATSAALYYVVHSTLATALIFLVADLVSRRRAHHAFAIWPAVLISSFLMLLGLARAGSLVFWKPFASDAPHDPAPDDPAPDEPLALAAAFALLVALVMLTLAAGPVTDWLTTTAEALHAPKGYIAANRLEDAP